MINSKLGADALYSIAQVNAITGVAKPTIRFWESEFRAFLKPMRTSGNQRRYNRSDVEVIDRINHLVRTEGYTLEGARRRLEKEYEMVPNTPAPQPEEQLSKLADTMSDFLLKKLLEKSTI